MASNQDIQVTKLFAEFVSKADVSLLTPTVVAHVKEYLLDYLGVTVAAAHSWESTEQILKAVVGLGARTGTSTVVLKGNDFLPQYAGLMNAALGHTMDFDDTYTPGSLHAGRLPASTVEDAFGLALSKAAGSMQYLENGSWNKRLHPGFAVHDAFVAVSLAEAGVLGAARPFEGSYGLLHAYTPRTEHDLPSLVADLGSRWDFIETALKPYPACRMTHGLIEVGGRLGQETKGREVEKLTVSLSSPNHIVVGSQIPNKLHPANIVDAQFSAYFQLAHAWLYGSDTGIEFSKRLDDEGIHKLSDKIECVKDDSVKGFGSKLRVQYSDGETKEVDIPFPLGEPEHPFSRDRVEAKYFSLVTPVLGEGKAKNLKNLVENLESHSVSELLQLVS
ncbi:unnamed protein product [Clonostachys rosea f. rosea IK726]|uniref:Uncharacterized protein n=1 Tax=Clonostachys rosea f. rosea IK726 TaxID=1349383 RepID=A0ACA9U1I7_BIOOC|nr:unnamed protein product [Clonostachys rosea f. rosea IK726]